MIDLHCHVLAGIDDGPRTIEESLALARAAARAGTETIVATPHSSARYPNGGGAIRKLVDELNGRLRAERVPVEIVPGAEIAMTRIPELDMAELVELRLGNGPWLLLEPPFLPVIVGLDSAIARLHGEGHRVVLAHPERCAAFHRDHDLLRAFVADGVLTSITAGSLAGRFGKEVRRYARHLLADGLVHNVASDAHDAYRRPPGLAGKIVERGGGRLADWLMRAVPRAILAGEEIPPPPAAARATGRHERRRPIWRR